MTDTTTTVDIQLHSLAWYQRECVENAIMKQLPRRDAVLRRSDTPNRPSTFDLVFRDGHTVVFSW